jgi:hypothetical protein
VLWVESPIVEWGVFEPVCPKAWTELLPDRFRPAAAAFSVAGLAPSAVSLFSAGRLRCAQAAASSAELIDANC